MIHFLILFLFIGTANAANLPSDIKEEIISDFSGGLNTSVSPHRLASNYSSNLRNVYVDQKPGTILKRKGSESCGSSTNTLSEVNFMIPYYPEDGQAEFIISDSSVVLTTKDCQTYTKVMGGLSPSFNLSAVQVRNKMWFTNGHDPVFTWSNSSGVLLNGHSGTPNVPRGKYIDLFQERVFIENLNDNNSGIRFSALVDTNSQIIAPDAALAWPADNGLNVGQGDGDVITAGWVYRGQLNVSKNNNIFTLYGTGIESYFLRNTESRVGVVSDYSVQILDGKTIYLGKDGIYEFNGVSSQRISDNIKAEIENIAANTSRIISNIWATKTDFDRGEYYSSTSPDVNTDVLTVETSVYINSMLGAQLNSVKTLTLTITSTSTHWMVMNAMPISDNYSGRLSTITINQGVSGCSNITTATIIVFNQRSGETDTFTFRPQSDRHMVFSSPSITVLGSDISSSQLLFKVEWDTSACLISEPNAVILLSSITKKGEAEVTLSTNAAQFISEVSTVSTITFWDSFLAEDQTSGGAINYFIRLNTSPASVLTTSWIQITPGVVINSSPSSSYFQWAATLTSVNNENPPFINRVEVRHNEGQATSATPKSAIWKNRYWLQVSSDTNATSYFTIVKSISTNKNPNAWMIFDHDSPSLGIFNGTFYGGSNTSGKVLRLDYGTNDDGAPVSATYETPDLSLGSPFLQKTFHEIWLDADKELGNTLSLGVSVDNADYQLKSINLTGSGLYLKTLRGIDPKGNLIRLRFFNNDLDKDMVIHGVSVLYQPTMVRQ